MTEHLYVPSASKRPYRRLRKNWASLSFSIFFCSVRGDSSLRVTKLYHKALLCRYTRRILIIQVPVTRTSLMLIAHPLGWKNNYIIDSTTLLRRNCELHITHVVWKFFQFEISRELFIFSIFSTVTYTFKKTFKKCAKIVCI